MKGGVSVSLSVKCLFYMLSKEIFHISPLVRTISSLSATIMSAFTRKLDNLNDDQVAGLFGRADANRDLIMEQEREEVHNALYDDLKAFYEKYTKEKMGKKRRKYQSLPVINRSGYERSD